jgi:hypothetical protein
MTVNIKSYQQILGEMIRAVLPNTPLNDINAGSVLLTLLEAAASSDFDNSAAILNVLELLSLNNTRDSDLDNRAADYGLKRYTAQNASGHVTITDSTFTKRSTSLYSIKLPPIAGSTVLYVNNAEDWASTGSLYIGRGTTSFEGPIAYSSIENHSSFYKIILSEALKKDHLISETVVDKQDKTDRRVPAGTTVYIPANNQNPNINYVTIREAVLAAGEDTISGIEIVAQLPGSLGNAGIGTIAQFSSAPFIGAAVTNATALSDGCDLESDVELRERIKLYTETLSRGTRSAILAAIVGVSDSEEGKQVLSAKIQESPSVGTPATVYIDDGRGFQPSHAGQSVDVLLASANGSEEFLQLANFPLPRPQVINTVESPLVLVDGMQLVVWVDGKEESVTFNSSEFKNIATATLSEITIAINKAETFKCRLTEDSTRLLLYPNDYSAETIQVIAIRETDDSTMWANTILKFPTTQARYISLYHNNHLLTEKETSATLATVPHIDWNLTTSMSSLDLSMAVDNTPTQTAVFTASDFGGTGLFFVTTAEWAAAFERKFAGITATVTSSDAIQITSNKAGSGSALDILTGDLFDRMFSSVETSAAGQDAEFVLNRQTGNLRLLVSLTAGDVVTAGSADTKGNIISDKSTTGTLKTQPDTYSRPSDIVVVVDSAEASVGSGTYLVPGTTVTISTPSTGIMRVMSSSRDAFVAVQPHNYLYIASRLSTIGLPWISEENQGLFMVLRKGPHTAAGVDSYIDLLNVNVAAEGPITIQSSADIQQFAASTYPQIWRGADVDVVSGGALDSTLSNIAASIVESLLNVKSSVFQTSKIKTTSTTENDGGIASPVSTGYAGSIMATKTANQAGNPSHVATAVMSKDAVSFFKRDAADNTSAFLDKWIQSDIIGELSADASPEAFTAPFGEVVTAEAFAQTSVDDQLVVNKGGNKNHYRSIKEDQGGGSLGTQQNLPRTVMGYATGDEITVMKSLSFSPDDKAIFVLDQDETNKTVVVPMSRTGRISNAYTSNAQVFSAYDQDNEPDITFGVYSSLGYSH